MTILRHGFVSRVHGIYDVYCKKELDINEVQAATCDLTQINCLNCINEINRINYNTDSINHPPHYGKLPNGIECIDVAGHFNFNLGNAIKYIWRTGKKEGADPIEDLKKAQKYLEFEIHRLTEHG